MTEVYPKLEQTFFGMLLAGIPSQPRELSERQLRQQRLAAAKEAFDSGNELAALDAWYLCGGRDVPAWAVQGMPKDPTKARHRKKRTGRHARAIGFTRDHLDHLERYHTVKFARQRENVPWTAGPLGQNAYQRAKELLRYQLHHANVLSIKYSYKMVARHLREGRGAKYWHPASAEVWRLLRGSDEHGWVCYPME